MGTSSRDSLITSTERGLWCQAGRFHIDPWEPVERAVITHAHADHACPGCTTYLASPPTCDLLRARLGRDIDAQPVPFGRSFLHEDTRISLHPAGHILGSAQVRVEHVKTGEVWVASGDYKTDPDPTAERFEPVRCHTFITETTFALPIYRWPDHAQVARDINRWWRTCAEAGRTAVLLVYALGKAQRILHLLDPVIGPIAVHGSIPPLNDVYAAHGIDLPPCTHANAETADQIRGHGVILAPPSASSGPWIRRFRGPDGLRIAMVSGWMRVRGRRRWRSIDHGFALSDHADWPNLIRTIRETGATRVGLTHGSASTLARYLRETYALDTFVLPTRYTGEQLSDSGESASSGLDDQTAAKAST